MTQDLFRADGYLRECTATVVSVGEHGIVLDRTVFYPLGGGQAGDSGVLVRADGSEIAVADTRKGKDAQGRPTDAICHLPADAAAAAALQPGEQVTARIDWDRRHRLMRFHTTTHLLCHLVPQPVNGCSITPDYARLDFHMTDPLDKEALTDGIARLVAQALPVHVGTITDAQLDANPALVKSMSVQPPRGSGVVRTIRIGTTDADAVRIGTTDADAGRIGTTDADAGRTGTLIDFQPCGGTHVANTSEIGAVVVTRIEKKSATTRRVVLGFA